MPKPPEEPNTPLEETLPPEVGASPDEVSFPPGQPERWWRPDWRDSARHIGWRWVFVTPAVLALAVLIVTVVYPRSFGMLVAIEAKLLYFLAAVTASLGGFAIRAAARARSEPFCIHCGYNLQGLPDHHRCPECGQRYSWSVIAEYRRDPHWFIERWRQRHQRPAADAPFAAGPTPRRRRNRDGTE